MEKNNDVSFFSEKTNLFYKVRHIENDLPCLEISGIRMHCVKGGIGKSTREMVKAIAPLKGRVLDTCFGLGYTAIEIGRSPYVEEVVVFEKDENVLEIAKMNEESNDAFANKKIKIFSEPVEEGLKKFRDGYFDRILHDPPSFRIAGELYSQGMYDEFFRALKKNGRIFHYVGSPYAKRGSDIMGGVMRRLKRAGFVEVKEVKEAMGVIAWKR